jgi:hypothetical protein
MQRTCGAVMEKCCSENNNQGKGSSFSWTPQFLFWFNTQFWTRTWNSLCMCVIPSKSWVWRRLECMGIMEKWEIDAEIANQRFSSVPTRPGAWNSPWRAYQWNLQCCYCDNSLWRAATRPGEFSRISITCSCFWNPLSASVSYPWTLTILPQLIIG